MSPLEFRAYLASTLDSSAAARLAAALADAGHADAAEALDRRRRDGEGARFRLSQAPWEGTEAVVGTSVPGDLAVGEIWFDAVELAPMLVLPRRQGLALVSTRPVRVWQDAAFRQLVRWRFRATDFLGVSDLLEPREGGGDAPATRIYHEEAVAYAHWFGKYLTGPFELRAAADEVSAEQLDELLPRGLRLWREQEADSEFRRAATGRDDLGDDAGPALFDEWERRDDVGFSTLVLTEVGLLTSLPRRAYEFVELENAAPRPSAATRLNRGPASGS